MSPIRNKQLKEVLAYPQSSETITTSNTKTFYLPPYETPNIKKVTPNTLAVTPQAPLQLSSCSQVATNLLVCSRAADSGLLT